MKNRDQKITFRVTASEKIYIEQLASESGRSVEKYCRAMLTKPKAKIQPKPKPPAEVPQLLALSNALGNILNTISDHISRQDNIGIEKLRNAQALNLEIRRLIKEL